METIITTAGETATNNNSVANVKAGKAVRTTSLKQQLTKAEKDLKNMVNRKVDDTVLCAQKQIVEQLKQAITEKNSKKEAPAFTLKDEPITFQLAKTGEKVSKKIAFVDKNRTVNTKKVDEFIAIIDNGKYDDAYPIIVVEAKKLIKAGYTITDVNGRTLTAEEAEGYFVILDGQHKTTAFAKLILSEVTSLFPMSLLEILLMWENIW